MSTFEFIVSISWVLIVAGVLVIVGYLVFSRRIINPLGK